MTEPMEFKLVRPPGGGFVVKDKFFDNVFASTRIDEALMFLREQMDPAPWQAPGQIKGAK